MNTRKGVSFHFLIEDGNYTIYFDTDVVATILENLISNAMKYTDKGSITVSLRRVNEQDIESVEIEVKDTGRGIHPDSINRIFDRYFQEKKNFHKSGTGIGLALVQNLVKLHQGEIFVESIVNEGTVFRFRINADNDYPHAIHSESDETHHAEIHPEETEVTEEHKNRNESLPVILVIEDNEEINRYIVDSLSDNYRVHAAMNGKEGIEKAFNYIPNLIISDIMMPETDGLKLTKTLKNDMRTSHIPIILLTAKDSTRDRTEGYNLGADSYITKPFSASLLRSRIINLLESRRKLAEQLHGNPETKAEIMMQSLNKLDKEFIEKVTSIIVGNLDSENLDVNLIADQMFMSHSTLYRKIKALMGISINEFIRKTRVRKAEELLLTGKYTVSEIAFMVGINSITYFRQCFKEEFGFTPSDYVRNIREKN